MQNLQSTGESWVKFQASNILEGATAAEGAAAVKYEPIEAGEPDVALKQVTFTEEMDLGLQSGVSSAEKIATAIKDYITAVYNNTKNLFDEMDASTSFIGADQAAAVKKYIGLDISLKNNSRLIFTSDVYKINDSMTLFSCNENRKSYDLGSFGLNMIQDGKFMPDDFRHEQYLLINENGKNVLISGCSHKGIMNIAEWFKPDVLIGGFHFSKLALDKTLENYAETLDKYNTNFYTCHCTGIEQYVFMKKYMSRLKYLSAGQEIII